MNRPHKKEYWYKELESHIRATHAASGYFKTILINQQTPHLYLVVTRVNHLTTLLWKEHLNYILTAHPEIKMDRVGRIGWLETQKQYRRSLQEKIISKIINHEEAPQNNSTR
jgi:hypothetical protein